MKRVLLAFSAVILFTGPLTAGPTVQLAKIEDDKLVLPGQKMPVTVTKYVEEKRIVTENGMQKVVTVKVPVQTTQLQPARYPLKDVTTYDLRGQKIEPTKLAEMLQSPRGVLISTTPTLAPEIRAILNDDTPIVILPSAPAIALPPAPKPATAN